MRFWVESWDADYGSSLDMAGEPDEDRLSDIDLAVECPPDQWRPVTPAGSPAARTLFVDGVQRIDARLWSAEGGEPRQGLCVSYAAGIVSCDTAATIEARQMERRAVGPGFDEDIACDLGIVFNGFPVKDDSSEALNRWLNEQREDLEIKVAHAAGPADLVIVDGHVKGRESIENVVGYIKSHNQRYLEPPQAEVVSRLAPGQRTPVFLLSVWRRYSWYLRLPGGQGHPWSGIVRCEASPALRPADVIALADLASATLPRFASRPHKEPRAPQNLYPVAGLERDLRHRLGDRALVLRALQRASNRS